MIGGVTGSPRTSRRALALMAVTALLTTLAACSRPPLDPLRLEGNLLTVDNQTANDWSQVEVWLNTYYRVTTATIPAGSRFQTPLDAFVAGFGQRFDFKRMQVKDLRLTAKLPAGEPLELKKQFQASGLAGALGGKR
jgi:hypothetical protein